MLFLLLKSLCLEYFLRHRFFQFIVNDFYDSPISQPEVGIGRKELFSPPLKSSFVLKDKDS